MTENYTKVTENIYVAPQVSVSDLEDIGQRKIFASVFNLRHPTELSFLHEEEEILASYDIPYYHEIVTPETMTPERMDEVLAEIDHCPKPTLVHCASMMRAAALGVLHTSTRNKMQSEDIMGLVSDMGFDCSQRPEMKAFVFGYIQNKLEIIMQLPEIRQVSEDILVGPQATEEQFQMLKEEKNVKSVLNLRSVKEKGKLGMGILAREESIVTGLGMKYVNVETEEGVEIPEEKVEELKEVIDTIEKPVYVHCNTFNRTKELFQKLGYEFPEHDADLGM
eukprot:TRINITY_DN13192_c0_g1_i1.p1 TRINITY_DN13192_c0_g1~~TRINITY_DN13192_c0_g1_i1.p1  ORF type:complete len:279 (-),score=72.87 TRINITY_DN13192_c0_g1_i1:31-867(-)